MLTNTVSICQDGTDQFLHTVSPSVWSYSSFLCRSSKNIVQLKISLNLPHDLFSFYVDCWLAFLLSSTSSKYNKKLAIFLLIKQIHVSGFVLSLKMGLKRTLFAAEFPKNIYKFNSMFPAEKKKSRKFFWQSTYLFLNAS